MQLELPVPLWYKPAAQFSQLARFGLLPNIPGLQFKQPVVTTAVEYLPCGQDRHVTAPVVSEKVPALHCPQSDDTDIPDVAPYVPLQARMCVGGDRAGEISIQFAMS